MVLIDTLPKLIQRLRDPTGDLILELKQAELQAITKYNGIDDFAKVYYEFLAAVKANTTVKQLRCPRVSKQEAFPIINPLCRHLSQADTLHIELNGPASWYLVKEVTRFKTVFIEDHLRDVDATLTDINFNPGLEVFHYNHSACHVQMNAMTVPMLMSLPFPSQLIELRISGDRRDWSDEEAVPFTTLELNRLVEIIQLPSLRKLRLCGMFFATMNQCSQIGLGLVRSSVQDLTLEIFTPDAANYRDIAYAFSKMPNLVTLDVCFLLVPEGRNTAFSLPLGDFVSGGLTSLTCTRYWDFYNTTQCQHLAAALKAPSCKLKSLDLRVFSPCLVIADLAIVISSLSAPTSTVETFTVDTATFKKDEDLWLSMLPRTSNLRWLNIRCSKNGVSLSESQGRKLVEVLSRLYHLESCIVDLFTHVLDEKSQRQLETLLRLNAAGRHYLTSWTRSQVEGVEVLVKVREHLNDLYTHLLENPSLCDRRCVLESTAQPASQAKKKSRHSYRGGFKP